METPDPSILPEKLITYWDIAKGLSQVIFHALTDQMRNPGLSDHFVHDPLATPIEPITSLSPELREYWQQHEAAALTALHVAQERLNGPRT